MTEGILREATDYYGKDYTERTISVNIRSQMSSLAKNFDTLYEELLQKHKTYTSDALKWYWEKSI